MARGDAASAAVHTDSIKGLAQSVADPAYRRLLTAEPLLRRAVPVLIVAFLVTIGIGTVVQVLEQRRQALKDGHADLEALAEVVAERLSRPGIFDPAFDPQGALERALPTAGLARQRIFVSDDAGTIVAA